MNNSSYLPFLTDEDRERLYAGHFIPSCTWAELRAHEATLMAEYITRHHPECRNPYRTAAFIFGYGTAADFSHAKRKREK